MLGPRKTCSAVVVGLSLMLASAACGGSSEAAAPDDATAVETRWDEYWQARIASENSADRGLSELDGLASGKALESQARRLRNYGRNGLVRVGEPDFRDVEVRSMEESATVLACFNADEWTAEVNGKPWSARKFGWELTGSVMKQVEGVWTVVEELSTDDIADMGKTC